MNLAELQSNLRKFYPESERRNENEGRVTIELYLGTDGRVTTIEVLKSAGAAFDGAARKVAMLLRYSPAMLGSNPVAVKMKQTIEFKLEQ